MAHTTFSIISGTTVPNNYSWDNGTPFSSTSPLVSTSILPVADTITGYSPGVKVYIENTSDPTTTITTNFTAISSLFVWDFGDYYNHANNTYSLGCTANVSHVYVMPGTYTITLTKYDTYLQVNPLTNELEVKTNILGDSSDDNPYQSSNCVIVQEILPVANFYPVTSAIGPAPHTVRLTARTTRSGSFPIEKIVWDFGDGTPQLTVSRYATAVNDFLVKNNILSGDPADPRNYDPVHTYYRSYNTFPVFYPSITAYASSTNSLDSCSITIGPISLSSVSEKIKILKSSLTPKETFYALQVEDNVAFVKTLTSAPTTTVTSTTPTNTLRNSSNRTVSISGNPGTDYYTVQITC